MTGENCADVLRRDIIEDAYTLVERLIHRICWKFQQRYGGEYDEWLGEAHLIFVEAMHRHDGRSSIVTWIYYQLHWGLYNVLRRRNVNRRVTWKESINNVVKEGIVVSVQGHRSTIIDAVGQKHKIPNKHLVVHDSTYLHDVLPADEHITEEDFFEANDTNTFRTLMEHLHDSGRDIWQLILDPPTELQGQLDENDPDCSWDAIRRYCEWRLRWTCRQMREAISELKEICSD